MYESPFTPLNTWMPLPGNGGLLCALLAVLWGMGLSAGFCQIQTTDRTLEKLKREFTDPLTILPQVFLKDVFSPVNYGTNVQTIRWSPGQSFHEFHRTHCCLSSNSFDQLSHW